MKKLLIANFKQNKTKAEVVEYFSTSSFGGNDNCDVVIAPSFVHIGLVKELGKGVEVAGQSVSPFSKGSYTGAVGAFQLKDLGVKYCIVGHSERRRYFAESSQVINNQIKELESVEITPIICFSSIDEVRQVETATKCFYLYEPLDAINSSGVQSNASDNKDIEEMFLKVKEVIAKCLLIYGGSVDENNISRLCQIPYIYGFVVGTASLNAQSFLKIYRKVK